MLPSPERSRRTRLCSPLRPDADRQHRFGSLTLERIAALRIVPEFNAVRARLIALRGPLICSDDDLALLVVHRRVFLPNDKRTNDVVIFIGAVGERDFASHRRKGRAL